MTRILTLVTLEIINEDLKFKTSDIVTIQNIKSFLQNTVFQISLKKLLWLKKLKPLYPGNLLLSSDIKDEEIVGIFYIKELQRTNQKEFRGEKVIKRKSDKLYVKWNGYDNLF